MFSSKNILFKVSSSIAAFKSAALVSKLVQAGHSVQVACTEDSLNFVGAATWEGLTSKTVFYDVFKTSQMMEHIHLNKWADLCILCPATANTINAMAAGIANNAVTNLFFALDFSKPYFVVPAMNDKMYAHPATVESLKKLRSWGLYIFEPSAGRLACGDEGQGKMMEPDEIIKRLREFYDLRRGPSVLVTAGGTRENLDGVRQITNMSTGATAKVIADELIKDNFTVTYLKSQGAATPSGDCRVIEYSDFSSLKANLFGLLRSDDFSAVIHAAAVSDFSVDKVFVDGVESQGGKLSSKGELVVHFKNNEKLINSIKSISKNSSVKLVGFKLTNGGPYLEKVEKVFNDAQADIVVHNDLGDINANQHVGTIFTRDEKIRFSTKQELAYNISAQLQIATNRTRPQTEVNL